MKPLFEVGEQVILQSKSYPEYSGEYTVESISYTDERIKCRLTGLTISSADPGVGYTLNEPLLDTSDGEGFEIIWSEGSLKKKHKPSELSFNEMMNTFKITEKM